MSAVEVVWRLNIPELLGLAYVGLDDAGVDADGNVYVSDGTNGRVYKFQPDGVCVDAFSVVASDCTGESVCGLNLAVAPDSTFYLADAANDAVIRYDEYGGFAGEFAAPGALSLCRGSQGLIYVFTNAEGIERINSYDSLGALVDTIPAPARHRAHLDPGLVNLDSDFEGNVYVSYGMPPYRIWKVKADGSGIDTWGRAMDYPEDAILIADIAFDQASGVLWTLLACKQFGRQMLDSFGPDGEFLGTVEIPQSEHLYSVICAAGESDLYLLDTGTSPGSGDLMRIALSA